jgi:hypothetical protein
MRHLGDADKVPRQGGVIYSAGDELARGSVRLKRRAIAADEISVTVDAPVQSSVSDSQLGRAFLPMHKGRGFCACFADASGPLLRPMYVCKAKRPHPATTGGAMLQPAAVWRNGQRSLRNLAYWRSEPRLPCQWKSTPACFPRRHVPPKGLTEPRKLSSPSMAW